MGAIGRECGNEHSKVPLKETTSWRVCLGVIPTHSLLSTSKLKGKQKENHHFSGFKPFGTCLYIYIYMPNGDILQNVIAIPLSRKPCERHGND